MLNIRSKPNNITPQLVYMWERSNEAEYEEEYYHQDQKVIQTMQKVTSMETLTQTEWEVLFLTLRSSDEESTSEKLMLSTEYSEYII
ncbi:MULTISPECIES: hypothetical protein [Photorhabdus]|uniref:Uncharacterized protein n=1 Tax=Photorhabdus thracensis TaxID=230089 RepID=A0A0F7LUE9_9GAMM|nr:hypothetical protein VY86_21075 [Photorhabdus thracensis]